MTDIEIANSKQLLPIEKIAKNIGIDKNSLEMYGKYKAKINITNNDNTTKGKLILVTSINPTPYGEGKQQ
jgi:formate--tetrahydrofolate ligase